MLARVRRPALAPAAARPADLGGEALERAAEVGAALGMPTGAAAGRRERLPTRAPEGRPALGVLTTGPVRGEWLEAVLAKRRQVDREIDGGEKLLADAFLPVEHCERQARSAPGRKRPTATDLAFRA